VNKLQLRSDVLRFGPSQDSNPELLVFDLTDPALPEPIWRSRIVNQHPLADLVRSPL
jgi:hypothetical protein